MSRHPLHPALVHFPVACWSLGVAVDAASFVPSVAIWLEGSERWSAGLFAVGCLGYVMRVYDFPIAPVLIGRGPLRFSAG